MILSKCTFDQLPDAMQMHVLYVQKIKTTDFHLAVWSERNTLYWNDMLDSELEEIVSIIGDMSFRYWNEEDAHGKTLEKYYNKYGYAVYSEIADAHRYLRDKADYALAERTVKKYMPKIDKEIDRLKHKAKYNENLVKAMCRYKGKRFKSDYSTDDMYLFYMVYMLGAGLLKWEDGLL